LMSFAIKQRQLNSRTVSRVLIKKYG
jgi:hypothetical protein